MIPSALAVDNFISGSLTSPVGEWESPNWSGSSGWPLWSCRSSSRWSSRGGGRN